MKKQEKVDLIKSCIGTQAFLRMYFRYDENYWYYYPHAVSDTLVLGQEEDDFLLNGYQVRKLSHLQKVEVKNDLCIEINQWCGVTAQLADPGVAIGSWYELFSSLADREGFVIVQNDFDDRFAIGLIREVRKSRVSLLQFDADGVWDDDLTDIPYSAITCVKWNTRYDEAWYRYLREHGGLPDKR